MKKPTSKWITAIVLLLVAGLFYAVYFTDLEKPESSESEKSITTYGQTAIPTIFIQWSPVPNVELDWAYANQNLLKIAIIIHNLEPNMDPVDWICNPQITMDKPVPRRLSRYELNPVHDASGASVHATYEYEINASGYVSLAVDMDIIIGPCAHYLNFQETTVTPFIIPELVGNYHLSFQVPVKLSTPNPSLSLTPTHMAMETWRGLPILPGGIETNDLTADYPVYRYIIENVDIGTVRDFYENQMQSAGWELLGIADTSVTNTGEGYSLWFAKDQDVVTVGVVMKENTTHVLIHLE